MDTQPNDPKPVRKSKPREEQTFLQYATTPRGAYRIKRAYRQMKKYKK